MNDHFVITIGREAGSGGKIISQMLAEKLGVKCYDKELITLAAKQSGLCTEVFENFDEKPSNSLLYSIAMDPYSGMSGVMNHMPLNHQVFLAQFETIRNLAAKESCVIVGRCADYALSGMDNVTSVFICANREDRIKEISRRLEISESKAEDKLIKADKKRASYYNFYSEKRWGEAKSYQLCLNSSVLGYEGCVDMIIDFVEKKNSRK